MWHERNLLGLIDELPVIHWRWVIRDQSPVSANDSSLNKRGRVEICRPVIYGRRNDLKECNARGIFPFSFRNPHNFKITLKWLPILFGSHFFILIIIQ